MADPFADITLEEGEYLIWRGAPQSRVSPMRWWYLFPASALSALAALGFAGLLPLGLAHDGFACCALALVALVCLLCPFLFTRHTNSSQYFITNYRTFIDAVELTAHERSCHDYEDVFDCKLEPLHNGLASYSFTTITHKRFGKREVEKVLLYAIPASVAEALDGLFREEDGEPG